MARRHYGPLLLLALAAAPSGALAQRQLTIVEGAACAHLSSQIEALGLQNETMVNGIAEIADGREAAKMVTAYEHLVTLRKTWMEDYERFCSRGVMGASDLRRICRTESGGFNFRNTAFCKPLNESGL